MNDNANFQFDDILKGLDRQIETQVNPIKKFNLDDEDIESIHASQKLRKQSSMNHDNQSSNRLESLC